jgi:hypothetical protein
MGLSLINGHGWKSFREGERFAIFSESVAAGFNFESKHLLLDSVAS